MRARSEVGGIGQPEVLKMVDKDTPTAADGMLVVEVKAAGVNLRRRGRASVVPLFVKTGDVVRVDLQAMKYMDRVKTDR